MSTEKVNVKIYEISEEASQAVARRISRLIRTRAREGRNAVLGLATGSTPVNVYRELMRMHREEGLDFSNVITFNLDEYWPINPDAFQSYNLWMRENFFKGVNIPEDNIHIPCGTVPEKDLEKHCREYERKIADAGGIDLQILGIGRSGHIGFNEPGSGRDSRTRRILLDKITRMDAASEFFGEENVPEMAITMGVGTILEAKEICLLAFGEHKAPIIRRAVEEGVSSTVAASFLQEHPESTFFLDEAAAASLTRMSEPWLVMNCEWDEMLECQAVIWLALKLDKPILKLTDEDYGENGLGELLRARGGAYHANLNIFRRMMRTITGWPGGKEGPKRVLVFSPHPDDDVICMGGTMRRLVEQGHEVHSAYMVSGFLSVFDHDVARYADFVRDFNSIFGLTPDQSASIEEHIDQFLRQKNPGDIDSKEVQEIKALIRRTEAIDASRYCGLSEENIHFLNMPFYNTGQVQKSQITDADIEVILEVLNKLKPDILFAAGDLSDPHGTHRLCLNALFRALEKYKSAEEPVIWLYRGAWQEWPAEQISMAVPLSPDELSRKRFSIFRHESQKDRAMFPGPYDSREFWQRAEERNIASASLYDQLGLPEYHAIEAFARHPLNRAATAQAQMSDPEDEPAS
jgi:glucosamine-6-phosphate deaminase